MSSSNNSRNNLNDHFSQSQHPGVFGPSPAAPAFADPSDDGASVSRMARERMPEFVYRSGASSSLRSAKHSAWRGISWSALSFGLLLLASGAACMERLAWMGGH